jgi:GDPmannose 4,6-dehydratase
MSVTWQGAGVDEKGYDTKGQCIVAVDPEYFRPTEVETLLGDASKAKQLLGWEPEITFDELVTEMVEYDLAEAKNEQITGVLPRLVSELI